MPKLGRPLPFNLVRVRSAGEVRQFRERSRRNLRSHTALFVFFFTGIFLARLVLALADFHGLSFSSNAIPVWIAIAIATPLFVVADILIVMSIVGNMVESAKNRRSLWAFILTIVGYVIFFAAAALS
jgi:hypothetical protein